MTNQEIKQQVLGSHNVVIRSYEINGTFYCHVENADPGAVIARASGKTRAAATTKAIEKASQRLQP